MRKKRIHLGERREVFQFAVLNGQLEAPRILADKIESGDARAWMQESCFLLSSPPIKALAMRVVIIVETPRKKAE